MLVVEGRSRPRARARPRHSRRPPLRHLPAGVGSIHARDRLGGLLQLLGRLPQMLPGLRPAGVHARHHDGCARRGGRGRDVPAHRAGAHRLGLGRLWPDISRGRRRGGGGRGPARHHRQRHHRLDLRRIRDDQARHPRGERDGQHQQVLRQLLSAAHARRRPLPPLVARPEGRMAALQHRLRHAGQRPALQAAGGRREVRGARGRVQDPDRGLGRLQRGLTRKRRGRKTVTPQGFCRSSSGPIMQALVPPFGCSDLLKLRATFARPAREAAQPQCRSGAAAVRRAGEGGSINRV
mmetsp:Transcript_43628/g.140589  ORF Transcript_43628/g.140589 Transcript_43628/m.140589 type:complete len:294 (-) Transcript_43628:108-989(-)